jgi:endoglucanase
MLRNDVLAMAKILPCLAAVTWAGIAVDQFGYRSEDPKIAVISRAQLGFGSQDTSQPGSLWQIRDYNTKAIVWSGQTQDWNLGQTHEQSGDRAWHFDFSQFKQPGLYYLYDPSLGQQSVPFEIRANPYKEVLRQAVRTFFYQRSGFAKRVPYAEERLSDSAAFLGKGQDLEARSILDSSNQATARDLSGGWFDAGDYNKYVTFASQPVHQLLDAYEQKPMLWGDNTLDGLGIPETGNGRPDLLDEIKWELDFLLKMQDADGGVWIKTGTSTYTGDVAPPSATKTGRYYGRKCSAPTIALASMAAHAAVVYKQRAEDQAYAKTLETAAIKAWDWFHQNPWTTDCDLGEIKSGDADWSLEEQKEERAAAAVYLWELTALQKYHDSLAVAYKDVKQLGWWGPYGIQRGDAMLRYTRLPGAQTAIQSAILNAKKSSLAYSFMKLRLEEDPYLAHMPDDQYHWGSNTVQANMGLLNWDVVRLGLGGADSASFRARALASIQAMHGVNPLNKVYLSQMEQYGAENSVKSFYHTWFGHGTPWDSTGSAKGGPAPGYVVGGPNGSFTKISALKNEPIQKRYADINSGWPQDSWEITEPAIYTQAAYIKLLSAFVEPGEGGVIQAVQGSSQGMPFKTWQIDGSRGSDIGVGVFMGGSVLMQPSTGIKP